MKILSKTFSEKLKEVCPSLTSSQQTAYGKNRHTGLSKRLIADKIETAKWNDLESFLIVGDIEKSLDILDETFLISALKKYAFGQKNFFRWNLFQKVQEPCVMRRNH